MIKIDLKHDGDWVEDFYSHQDKTKVRSFLKFWATFRPLSLIKITNNDKEVFLGNSEDFKGVL